MPNSLVQFLKVCQHDYPIAFISILYVLVLCIRSCPHGSTLLGVHCFNTFDRYFFLYWRSHSSRISSQSSNTKPQDISPPFTGTSLTSSNLILSCSSFSLATQHNAGIRFHNGPPPYPSQATFRAGSVFITNATGWPAISSGMDGLQ